MRAVAWNGLEIAFDIFEERWHDLRKPDNSPFRVLILGTGMVGKQAVERGTLCSFFVGWSATRVI